MSEPIEIPNWCECGDRLVTDCPGAWDPGCDMGADHVGTFLRGIGMGEVIERLIGPATTGAKP